MCAIPDVISICAACVDRALATTSSLDRSFWLGTLADARMALPAVERHAYFLTAGRRISATFAASTRERQDAVRVIADRLLPIA